MSLLLILLSAIVSGILFVMSIMANASVIAVNTSILVEQKKSGNSFRDKVAKTVGKAIPIVNKSSNKSSNSKLLALKTLKASLKFVGSICRGLALIISFLGTTLSVTFLLVGIIFLGTLGYLATSIGNADADSTGSSYQKSIIDKAEKSKEEYDNYASTYHADGMVFLPASVDEIIAWDEATLWSNISGGKFTSKAQAQEYTKDNPEEIEKYFRDYVISIDVPVWKFADSQSLTLVPGVETIKVLPVLEEYWREFFKALYEASDQYVVLSTSSWRWTTVSSSGKYSMHCFGLAMDVNGGVEGMGYGYNPNPTDTFHLPFKSINDVPSERMKHLVCTFDNSFFNIAKSFEMQWGGVWSGKGSDGMHFQLKQANGSSPVTYIKTDGMFNPGTGLRDY